LSAKKHFISSNAVSTSDATRQSSESAHQWQERVGETASAISALADDVQSTGELPVRSAAGADQTSASRHELSQLANALQGMVRRLRV
jgi:methyl-accepting chemotaxis protein